MINPENDLVTIRTYPTEAHASIDRAHLESEGIPALVLPGEITLHHGLNEYKLIVPRALEERALDIMNSTGDDDFSESELAADHCLACREPMSEQDERCIQCGWSFADGAEADE